MPIPKPKKGEGEKDFISRCMSAIGDEYKDKDQAVAVCYQSWKDKSSPRQMVRWSWRLTSILISFGRRS